MVATRTVALAASIALVGAPRAATAVPCSTRHQTLFELYDLATAVATATVRVGQPPSHAGPVELDVHEQLKGAPTTVLHAAENGECTAGLRTGKEVLVFVGADGLAVGFWSGVVELPAPARVTAMRAWRDATTPAAQVEALVAAIESPDGALAADAAYYLADEPALLVAVDDARAARIAAHTGGEQWGPEIILTRLHGPQLAALQAARALPRDLRAIARHRFEAVKDPAVLALAMARAHADLPRRVAAFERCERLHGRRLERFSTYDSRALGAATWRVLATACRTGTPPTVAALDQAAATDDAAAPPRRAARRW